MRLVCRNHITSTHILEFSKEEANALADLCLGSLPHGEQYRFPDLGEKPVDVSKRLQEAADTTLQLDRLRTEMAEAVRRFDEIRANIKAQARAVLGKAGDTLVKEVNQELAERDATVVNRLTTIMLGADGNPPLPVPLVSILPAEARDYNAEVCKSETNGVALRGAEAESATAGHKWKKPTPLAGKFARGKKTARKAKK